MAIQGFDPHASTEDLIKLQKVLELKSAQDTAAAPQPSAPQAAPQPQTLPQAQPDVAAPNSGDPYRFKAQDYGDKASALEAQAKPPARPQGFLPNLVLGASEGLQGANHPGGFAGFKAQQDAQERQREQDLLGRAKQYREEGSREQQLGLTEEQRQIQNEAETRQEKRNTDLYNLKTNEDVETARHNRVVELRAQDAAKNKVEFAPAGSQPFKDGQPIGAAIPKEQTPKSLQTKEVEFKSGGHGTANFNPDTGKFHDPVTSADISANVKGLYERPTAGSEATQLVQDSKGNWVRVKKEGPEGDVKIGGNDLQAPLPAATRTKAYSGSAVESQAKDLEDYAMNPTNADIFGKIGGRWTDLMAGKIGTDDPRMSRLLPKIQSLAALLAPLHGFRGQNAVQEFIKTMPPMDSPQAFAAAVHEYENTAKRVEAAGGLPDSAPSDTGSFYKPGGALEGLANKLKGQSGSPK